MPVLRTPLPVGLDRTDSEGDESGFRSYGKDGLSQKKPCLRLTEGSSTVAVKECLK